MTARMNASSLRRLPAPHRAQRGVVMYVALVVLIVMTLAGLAMLRQMSSGSSIAGNIAFKQAATAVADAGIEAGRAWLGANAALLDADQPANGYYATWAANVDPTSTQWMITRWNVAPTLAPAVTGNTGNTVRYVIERLCSLAGPPEGGAQQCSDSIPASGGGESKGGGSYGEIPAKLPASPFYRITAQVTGPRNTVSYTQVVLN